MLRRFPRLRFGLQCPVIPPQSGAVQMRHGEINRNANILALRFVEPRGIRQNFGVLCRFVVEHSLRFARKKSTQNQLAFYYRRNIMQSITVVINGIARTAWERSERRFVCQQARWN